MQYATMVDLIDEARKAGASELTGYANEILSEIFRGWLADQHLGELTEEEEDALTVAFEEGYGIRPPCPCRT